MRLPLATMNRHGLIAGATGTGKTKTLQLIAEQLSAQGVPVFVADVKGDVSGLAEPGEAGGPAEKRDGRARAAVRADRLPGRVPLARRHRARRADARDGLGLRARSCSPRCSAPTRRRSPRSALVFHYADTKGLPLLDLADLRALLTFLDSKEGKAELEGIGGLSKATVGVLLRALVGAGDRRRDRVLRRAAARHRRPDARRAGRPRRHLLPRAARPSQDRPGLFSTVMMWLVAELFEQLPEAGDLDKPKLVFFLDEAHLLFADATDAFVESVDAHGAADPLQGRRRLLRHPGADRPAGARARRSSAAASSTRCARSRPRTRRTCARSSRPTRRRTSTTSASC